MTDQAKELADRLDDLVDSEYSGFITNRYLKHIADAAQYIRQQAEVPDDAEVEKLCKSIERHVGSYKSLSLHRAQCLWLVEAVRALTAERDTLASKLQGAEHACEDILKTLETVEAKRDALRARVDAWEPVIRDSGNADFDPSGLMIYCELHKGPHLADYTGCAVPAALKELNND